MTVERNDGAVGGEKSTRSGNRRHGGRLRTRLEPVCLAVDTNDDIACDVLNLDDVAARDYTGEQLPGPHPRAERLVVRLNHSRYRW